MMGRWSKIGAVFGFCVLLCCFSLTLGVGDEETYTPKDAYTEYEFPNPAKDFQECGVDSFSFVCDPGRSISKSAIQELNDLIYSLRESSTCLCDSNSNCRKRYLHKIKIAIVPRIKYITGGFPTSTETEISAARQFGEYLRDTAWDDIDWCALQIFIVYDVYTKRIWTATDKYAFKVITNEQAKETGVNAKKTYFDNDMIFTGLKDMVTKYKAFLDAGIPPKFTWWQILLIVLGTLAGVALLVGLFCCALKSGGRGGGYSSSSGGGFWSFDSGGGGGGGGGGSSCGGGGGG